MDSRTSHGSSHGADAHCHRVFSLYDNGFSAQATNDRLDSCLRHAGSLGNLGNGVVGRPAYIADELVTLLPQVIERLVRLSYASSELLKVVKGRHVSQCSD